MDHAELDVRAGSLINDLAAQCDDVQAQSCKPTMYDTAWIAMLSKPHTNGTTEWAFPESFTFLLDHQQGHGGWTTCNSKVDAILNTLAALLALKKHQSSLQRDQGDVAVSLDLRASNAVAFLQKEMSDWDPEVGAHLGFEILVPALLLMLKQEGIVLHFPGRSKLMRMNEHGLSQFDPQQVYTSKQHPMLCFLEAFLGVLDFQRLRYHKEHGGMSHSPSSTAAYLMGLEVWDEESEDYLRTAIRATGTPGGVPSSFPWTAFESALIMEALSESGFPKAWIENDTPTRISASIRGYASVAEPLPLFALNLTTEELHTRFLLAKIRSPERPTPEMDTLQNQLMNRVEAHGANFNTTCSILKTLLRSPLVSNYERYVASVSHSLCDMWWSGASRDGQHLSPFRSMMLFAEGFAKLHWFSESVPVGSTTNTVMEVRAPVVIVQILARIVSTQNNDGSWGPLDCAETTAYALLALLAIANLPYVQVLTMEIRYAVERGRQALSLMREVWTKPHHLWVRKVAYGSERLSEAYALAAMKKSLLVIPCAEPTRASTDQQAQKILNFSKLLSHFDHLSKEPFFMIKASVLEGVFYQPLLKAIRTEVFPQTLTEENDKYLDYIPIMWILPSTGTSLFSPPTYLLDMMVLSMWVFLVDEYMESNVAHFSKDEFILFRKSLEEIDPEPDSAGSDISLSSFLLGSDGNGAVSGSHPAISSSGRLFEAIAVFKAFATTVMKYPSIVHASQSDLLELRSETKNYLLYHVTQLEDNNRLAQQEQRPGSRVKFATPRTSYHTWVHTVGAGHVSGPWAFAFFMCCMGGYARGGADCFTTVKQKLAAYKMNAHIGAFCRMYNDYGSIARDREEHNLNSVNFPEFFADNIAGESTGYGDFELSSAKEKLLRAAEYERQCAINSAETLYRDLEAEGAAGRKVADCLKVYIGACEQFSDMYLTRDVTNRVK